MDEISETLDEAIKSLAEGIKACEKRAFTAGWVAFGDRWGGYLVSHGVTDFRRGFDQAWEQYWKERIKE